MPTLSELYGLEPAAPAPVQSQDGQFTSGFKRSFSELPGLAAGVGGYMADVAGADGLRDKLLAYAKDQNDQTAAAHATDAGSLTDVIDGKADPVDFLKNAAGYVAGQALQSIATGGLGSLGMRALAKAGAREVGEVAAAKALAAGADAVAARKVAESAILNTAGVRGAAIGAGGHNFGMELGSIYPDAVQQAKDEGKDGLDAGDLARVGLSAGVAAGVDTAAEGITASRFLRGSTAGHGTLMSRLAREVPEGIAREAGTEAAQTAIEHYGAGQPIADDKGLRDIIDSAGVGAVGGGLGGGMAGLRAREHAALTPPAPIAPPVAPPPVSPGDAIRAGGLMPNTGPVSNALNAAVEAAATHADALVGAGMAAEQAGNAAADRLAPPAPPEGTVEPSATAPASPLVPDAAPTSPDAATTPAPGPDEAALAATMPAAPVTPAAPAVPVAPPVAPLAVQAPAVTPEAPADPVATLAAAVADPVEAHKVADHVEAEGGPETITGADGRPRPVFADIQAAKDFVRGIKQGGGSPPAGIRPITLPDGRIMLGDELDQQKFATYDDHGNSSGEPLKTKGAAASKAKKLGGEVVPVPGGFMVRVQRAPADVASVPAAAPSVMPAPASVAPVSATQPQLETSHESQGQGQGNGEEGLLSPPEAAVETEAPAASPAPVATIAQPNDAPEGNNSSNNLSSESATAPTPTPTEAAPAAPQAIKQPDAPAKPATASAPKDPLVVHQGAGGTVIDEEARRRRNLAEANQAPSAQMVGNLGAEHANMFKAADAKEARESFDAQGKYIGPKYRFVPKAARAGAIRHFNDLNEAKAFADSYGQKTTTTPAEKRKRIGKGHREQTIYENAEGVRSYTESGNKYTETPGKPREREFKTKAEQRAEHFAPGNVVKSYGGHDRVISYTPADGKSDWSVKVRAVQKDASGKWVDAGEREREHSTQPSDRELAAGPIERAKILKPVAIADQSESDTSQRREPGQNTVKYAVGSVEQQKRSPDLVRRLNTYETRIVHYVENGSTEDAAHTRALHDAGLTEDGLLHARVAAGLYPTMKPGIVVEAPHPPKNAHAVEPAAPAQAEAPQGEARAPAAGEGAGREPAAVPDARPASVEADGVGEPKPQYAAGDRVVADRDVINGDVLMYDGKPHMAMVKRGRSVPLFPMENGKPVVNADARRLVNLDDHDVRHTGENVYGYGGQPKPGEKSQATTKKAPAAVAATSDAGAELAANRRNRITTGISWSDIADKNTALKVKETTKQNVSPRPDYEALVSAGMPPLVAHLVKQVYDSIATTPQTARGAAPTDTDLQNYIAAVKQIMAGTMAWANDKEAVGKWAAAQASRASNPFSGAHERALLDAVFPGGWRAHEAALRIVGGNKVLGALQPGHTEVQRATKAVVAGFPATQEAWQKRGMKVAPKAEVTGLRPTAMKDKPHGLTIAHRTTGYATEAEAKAAHDAIKSWVLLDKAARMVGSYDTQEAAVEAAREQTKRDSAPTGPSEAGISVDEAERTGTDRRLPGEDITSERLKETFGLRGVNFGNWMKGDTKALVAERQSHLNRAFDAFMDLADLLGVPPKALSLNGMLGLAIGAQGNGGRAAAHFVPGVNEINLTRTAGAGALAHEWAHAVDHYFATLAGIAGRTDPFLTEHVHGKLVERKVVTENGRQRVVESPIEGATLRPEVLERFKAVVEAMNRKTETIHEYMARMKERADLYTKRVDGWLASIKRDFMAKKVDEAKFDALADRIRALDLGEGGVSVGASFVSPAVDELRALYKQAAGRVYDIEKIKGLQANVDALQYAKKAVADDATHVPQKQATKFAAEAAALDKDKGGKKYWSTDLEKFARSFDAFVSDKLAERAAKNTYLHGLNKDERTVPVGEERTAVNKAIQALVDTIETKDGENGNVALYSRTENEDAARRGTDAAVDPKIAEHAARMEAFTQAVTARWANAPEVIVAHSMDDEKVPQAVREHNAQQQSQGAKGEPEGFFYDGKVYLIADQLRGPSDALRVLMHESLGHYGLRSVFGKELGTILDRMAILNSGKVRTKARQYGLDFDKQSDRRAAAEEVLAQMAQDHPDLGWVKRAVAAIRTWLRDNVPGFAGMKLSDDEIVRSYILPAREFVKQGRVAPAGLQAIPAMQRTAEAPTPSEATDPHYSRSLGAALTDGMNNVREVKLPAGYRVGDLLNDSGKLSWWHKTVGTPYNLAQRSPAFRKVYDATQRFLNDVSYFATEAADLAPRILPKLSTWKDIARTPLSAADTKAIAAPIFEGTLLWTRDENGQPVKVADQQTKADALSTDDKAHAMLRGKHLDPNVLRMWQGLPVDQYEQMIATRHTATVLKPGIVFTDAELKQHFGLNDQQVSLYKEFRQATDKSLTNLAIADMVRFGGDDVKPVAQAAIDTQDVDKAGEMLRDHLFEQAKQEPDRADVLNDTANKMIDKADRARSLMDKGYAPLSRFGQYTLDVVDKDGDRVYFGLFESPAERSKMARRMADNYPEAEITQGTTSEEAYKMFAGVSPETLALFGEMLGLEEQGDDAGSQAFQAYLKLAKNSRSAMKRLIERKGIAGFSEDAGRVLAGFVYSNARQTASNLHMGEMSTAVQDIPQGQGQLKDHAARLVDYVKNPQQEAQGLRGMLFAQYLGGSVASAMVNATQPLMTTFPYLSQFVGVAQAGKLMSAAVKDALKGTTGDAKLDAALKKAEEDGIVSPQEVHSLQAQSAGRAHLKSGDGTKAGDLYAKASNVAAKVSLAWGQVFSVAEQFNRRTTFIAAYRAALAKGIADPAAFAAKAIAETQFTVNKGNKPAWARGVLGSTLFTFKQFSVSYLELLHRMYKSGPEGKRAALLALGVLVLMSGLDGLPGSDDLSDLIDGLMQRLGYNFNTKQEKRKFFASVLGEGGAQFLAKGISGLPGAPIDVSGRLSMSNLVPGTGLFVKKPDHAQDLTELVGPAGDFASRIGGSVSALAGGDIVKAGQGILPTAASNLAKAYDMATTGAYHDARGYKVIDASAGDALAKAVGFQPNDVSRIQEATGEAQRYKALHQLRTQEITAKWAEGLATGKSDLVQEAKDERDQWNANNPDVKLKVSMPSVLKKVQEMKKPKDQRIAESSPTGVRAKIKADLRAGADQ